MQKNYKLFGYLGQNYHRQSSVTYAAEMNVMKNLKFASKNKAIIASLQRIQ